jgi:hypothetical protein
VADCPQVIGELRIFMKELHVLLVRNRRWIEEKSGLSAFSLQASETNEAEI